MKRHSLRTDRVTRSDVERLEGRTLLANIAVANAYLTDVNFNRLETPPAVGEEYGIRVDFTTTDVPETTRFRVLNGVDGVNITSDPVAAGGTWHGRFGYFAKPEGAEIRVKLDSTALVAETDETDNEVTFSFTPVEPDPPFKMVNPVAGEYGEDWAVTVYADVDPRPGNESDYRDRGYVYDGSKVAWFSVGDYGVIDRGADVLAAGPGTVVEVRDGQPDYRYLPVPSTALDNYVLVDHGGGWQTRYGRLRDGSVAVTPGQEVTAGQKLALAGSSGARGYGQPNAPVFVYLEVLHNGAHVETFLAPDAYWQSPAPFIGDNPGVHYMTATDRRPINDASGGFEVDEHVYGRHVFHTGESVYLMTLWRGLNKEAVRRTVVYRPDGTQFILDPLTLDVDRSGGWRAPSFTLGPNDPLGTWEFTFEVDGVELGRTSFLVADRSEGLPEIKVYQGTTYVLDGRVTPLDFGPVNQGAAGARRVFSVRNHGTKPLAIERVELPEGFSVVGTPPASVPVNGTAGLTIQLDSAAAGSKGGWVTIRNNDAEQGEFTFRVKGVVNPVAAAVVGRHVFYDGSPLDTGGPAGDDAVIATDKQALPAGAAPSFANVTAYTRGINGVMVDVLRLPAGEPRAADFVFDVADAAAPGGWAAGPAPSSVAVRRGAGAGGSDRVTITWPDGAIRNTWLKVTAPANAATGLAAPDVFFFGNLAGETGDAPLDGVYRVNALDVAAVKRNFTTTSVPITNPGDLNRDGRVNALDLAAVKASLTRTLAPPLVMPAIRPATTIPPSLPGGVATAAVPAAPAVPPRAWDEPEADVLGRAGGGSLA